MQTTSGLQGPSQRLNYLTNNVNESLSDSFILMSKHYVFKYYSYIKKFEIQRKKAYYFEVHELYIFYTAIGIVVVL